MSYLTPLLRRNTRARGRTLALCLTLFPALLFPVLTVAGCGGGLKKSDLDHLNLPEAPRLLPLTRTGAIGDWISNRTPINVPVPLSEGYGVHPAGVLEFAILDISVSSDGAMTGTVRDAYPWNGGYPDGKLTGTCAEDGTYSAKIEVLETTTAVRGWFEIQGASVYLRMAQEGPPGFFGGTYFLDRH